MKFDLNNRQIRLHPVPQISGGMAWEASVSATRLAGMDYQCSPEKGMGGLADTLAPWLLDSGPQVALRFRMGGLWAPDLVGSEITLAVLGSSQSHAAAALEARSRELAMWLDVNGHGESWLPAEMASDVDLNTIPIDLSSTDRTVQRDCPYCHSDQAVVERFVEVSRRTYTGLQWNLRSRGQPQAVADEIQRLRSELIRRRRRTRLLPEVEHCEAMLARLERLESSPAGRPFEVAIAVIGFEPIENMVRFSATQAVSELASRRCPVGPELTLPGQLGVHGAFSFINGQQVGGIDAVTAQSLLRWVAAIDEPGELDESDAQSKGQRLIDPRLLFQAS